MSQYLIHTVAPKGGINPVFSTVSMSRIYLLQNGLMEHFAVHVVILVQAFIVYGGQ